MSVRVIVPTSLQCPHCDSKEEIRAWRALAVISYVCVQCGQTWTIDVEPDPQPSKPLDLAAALRFLKF
jgi:Zn ribbon nucleic-acid-binding protein